MDETRLNENFFMFSLNIKKYNTALAIDTESFQFAASAFKISFFTLHDLKLNALMGDIADKYFYYQDPCFS